MFNKKTRYVVPLKGSFLKTVKKIILTSYVLPISSKSILSHYHIDSIKALSNKKFKEYFRKSYVDYVEDLIYSNAFPEKANPLKWA